MDPLNAFGPFDMALTFTEDDFAEIEQLLRDSEADDITTTTFTGGTTTEEALFTNTFYNTTTETTAKGFDADVERGFYCYPQSQQPVNCSPESFTMTSFTESPVFSEMDFDMAGCGLDNNNPNAMGFFPYADSIMMPPFGKGTEAALVETESSSMAQPFSAASPSYYYEMGNQPTSSTSSSKHAASASASPSKKAKPPAKLSPKTILSVSSTTTPASTSISTPNVSSSSSSKYSCPHCDLPSFANKTKLKVHINKHTKPFRCTASECTNNAFAEKKTLHRHIRAAAKWDGNHRLAAERQGVQLGGEGVEFACPNAGRGCTYTTIRDDNLKRHISTCSV